MVEKFQVLDSNGIIYDEWFKKGLRLGLIIYILSKENKYNDYFKVYAIERDYIDHYKLQSIATDFGKINFHKLNHI